MCWGARIVTSAGRISGPLLNRIDLHVELSQIKAREISGDRMHKPRITCNARMGSKELKKFCALDDVTKQLLQNAMTEWNLSARAYDRILKVAWTIADLAASENLASDHVSEAIQYRSLDGQIWG